MEPKSTDRMFALIPLLGGLFAITYDVGYFWGVDPAFFSFFSLSEHIVFAAQAIPFAASLAVVMFLGVSWLFAYTENEARVPQGRTSMQRKSRVDRSVFWFFVIALLLNFILGN